MPPAHPETVNALFADALATRPDDIFVEIGEDALTFAAFDAQAAAYALGLQGAGVGRGDTVCGLLDSNMDALLLWFGVNRLAAIWVPLNSALKGEFLRHQIADSDARVMIVDAHYARRVAVVAEHCVRLERIFVRGEMSSAPIAAIAAGPLADLRCEHGDLSLVDGPGPHDLSLIIYTSGTTGPSKGCMVSHNYICSYARQMSWAIGLKPGDVYWFALPLFHMGGLGTGILGGLRSGCRIVVAPRFSVRGFWPDIERTGATVMVGVGATAGLIAEAPDNEAAARCVGQLRAVCAAPMTATHQAKWRTRFGVAHVGAPGYGLTEVSMATLHPIAAPSPAGSSGRRHADIDVRIADEAGADCPPGVAGRIMIRPRAHDVIFRGYWRKPEATVAALEDLWFDSGDIGRFDEDGFFFFVDRAKDYLRRRGENISSFEVETALREHAEIVDVAVHAVRSEVSEDDLKVTVVLKDGAMVTEEALCRWSNERLPHYAVPRYIEFRAELPRNPVGRVLKYQLRDEGVTAATWDRMTCPDIVVDR